MNTCSSESAIALISNILLPVGSFSVNFVESNPLTISAVISFLVAFGFDLLFISIYAPAGSNGSPYSYIVFILPTKSTLSISSCTWISNVALFPAYSTVTFIVPIPFVIVSLLTIVTAGSVNATVVVVLSAIVAVTEPPANSSGSPYP